MLWQVHNRALDSTTSNQEIKLKIIILIEPMGTDFWNILYSNNYSFYLPVYNMTGYFIW